MTLKIKWVGPYNDCSGYAQNAREYIMGLNKYQDKFDYDLAIEPITFESDKSANGDFDNIYKSLEKPNFKEDIRILHAIPEVFPNLRRDNVINIGYTMFETDGIPKLWAEYIQKYTDGLLLISDWCQKIFQDNCPNTICKSAPLGVFKEDYVKHKEPINKLNIPNNVFKFYSVFNWTPRKNPFNLIKAYYSEFTGHDDVIFVLKTYGFNHSVQESNRIKSLILDIKKNLKLNHYPKIYLITSLLSRQQIIDLHLQCNCFVLPHRGEGWGMPHFDSMLFGNPIITTNWSGSTQFAHKSNARVVDYQLTPVCDQPWTHWYDGTMYWAEPNIYQVKQYMREVYENYTDAKKDAKRVQNNLFKEFNWEKQVKNFLKCINEIKEGSVKDGK